MALTGLVLLETTSSTKVEINKLSILSKNVTDGDQQLGLALLILLLLANPNKFKQGSRKHAKTDKNITNDNLETADDEEVDHQIDETNEFQEIEKENKSGTWVAFKIQMQESFVTLLEVNVDKSTQEEIEKEEEELLFNLYDLELTTPVVIIDPLTKIKRVILFIDDCKYIFLGTNCNLRPMQACFKSMKAMDKQFPKAATAIWEYIQRYVFGIAPLKELLITKALWKLLQSQSILIVNNASVAKSNQSACGRCTDKEPSKKHQKIKRRQ